MLMTTSKIDDIIFRGGAHTQQEFRKQILNLTGSEPHPHISAINFARIYHKLCSLIILKYSPTQTSFL